MIRNVARSALVAGILASSLMLAGAEQSRAADLGVHAAIPHDAVWPHIWLGHFTGGRDIVPHAQPTALDWRDDHVLFESRQGCDRWLSKLTRAYHKYEGYRTCLLLR